MDVCLLRMLCVVQVQLSASGCSPVQVSPTACGASECDREVSTMTRPCRKWGKSGWRAGGGISHCSCINSSLDKHIELRFGVRDSSITSTKS